VREQIFICSEEGYITGLSRRAFFNTMLTLLTESR